MIQFIKNLIGLTEKAVTATEEKIQSIEKKLDGSAPKPAAERKVRILSTMDYTPVPFTSGNIEDLYMDFLSAVIEELGMQISNVEIDYDRGMGIYYRETNDMRVTVTSEYGTYITRFNDYIEPNSPGFTYSYYRNFLPLIQSINRYMLETNNTARLELRTIGTFGEKEMPLIRICSVPYNSEIEGEAIVCGNNASLNVTLAEAEEALKNYRASGALDMLPAEELDRGIVLAREYCLLCAQDVLWCFKNVIVPIAPCESSGYEAELKKLANSTRGHVTFSNYREEEVNGSLTLHVGINGKEVSIEQMPLKVSFRFLLILNIHLFDLTGRTFVMWTWQNNPPEQQTFLYLPRDYREKVSEQLWDLTYLNSEIVDMYEAM